MAVRQLSTDEAPETAQCLRVSRGDPASGKSRSHHHRINQPGTFTPCQKRKRNWYAGKWESYIVWSDIGSPTLKKYDLKNVPKNRLFHIHLRLLFCSLSGSPPNPGNVQPIATAAEGSDDDETSWEWTWEEEEEEGAQTDGEFQHLLWYSSLSYPWYIELFWMMLQTKRRVLATRRYQPYRESSWPIMLLLNSMLWFLVHQTSPRNLRTWKTS